MGRWSGWYWLLALAYLAIAIVGPFAAGELELTPYNALWWSALAFFSLIFWAGLLWIALVLVVESTAFIRARILSGGKKDRNNGGK